MIYFRMDPKSFYSKRPKRTIRVPLKFQLHYTQPKNIVKIATTSATTLATPSNTPSAVIEDTPSAVLEDTPSAVIEDTPSAVIEDTTSAVIEDTTSAVIEDTSSAVLEDTPYAVIEDTPSAVLEDTPSAVLEYTPSAVIEDTSSAVIEDTSSAVIEESPLMIILSDGHYLEGNDIVFGSIDELNSFIQHNGLLSNDVGLLDYVNVPSNGIDVSMNDPDCVDVFPIDGPKSDTEHSVHVDPDFFLESVASPINAGIPNENVEVMAKRLTRKRKRNTDLWKRNVRKSKHLKGEVHVNSVGVEVSAKSVKLVNCKCRLKCNENFSDNSRSMINQEYYALGDYKRQKDFILQNIVVRKTKTRQVKYRTNADGSEDLTNAKHTSVAYYLPLEESKKRVCKNMFLKTLSISNRAVLTAIANKTEAGIFAGSDGRGCQPSRNKTAVEVMNAVHEHISSFPKTESHYCRKDTNRQYLESGLTVKKMYSLYLDMCKKKYGEMHKPVSEAIYRRTFVEEYNLGFYHPKKDQCSECTKFNLMSAEDKERNRNDIKQHKERNEEAQADKATDKRRAIENSKFHSVTFDLQSVLQVPCSGASLMYYKRKLCCYNLTIYEQAPPNEAYCYLWSEVNGKRGSNEIGSCLYNYLKHLPNDISEISMFSDTCGGQNRNQNVCAILLHAVRTIYHIDVIEQKFLEKGHSYMECDSMHSAIERVKKNTSIYSVSTWSTVFELARKNHPYKVVQMQFSDFLDCKALCDETIKNRTKDENGNVVNWLKIKVLRFEKANKNVVQYKYRYADDFTKINILGRGRRCIMSDLKPCYKAMLPIAALKKADLLSLCKSGVIPSEHHLFFKNLPSLKQVSNINEDDKTDVDE